MSKDGQAHQVNTKDEFERYYNVEKDNELNKQRQVLENRISYPLSKKWPDFPGFSSCTSKKITSFGVGILS